MDIFTSLFRITKQPDGSYTVAMAVSDNTVVAKTVDLRDLQQLYADLRAIIEG